MIGQGGLTSGSVFAGDYRVLRPLGKGGMGEVYVAEQLSTGKQRALKLLHAELAQIPSIRTRFAQEARVAALIESEHVVEVLAAGVDASSGRPWLVMELLEGSDLARLVAARGPLDVRTVHELMLQICHALSAAHRAGIVHRDLKPENLFVARSRQQNVPFKVKVLDFGIAKLLAEARPGHTTCAMGTPLWMAPEQADGARPVGPQADVWALGLIVFWMLTGRSYWREATSPAASIVALMQEVLVQPIVAASTRASELGAGDRIPPGIDVWFASCVARDPALRFPDAGHAMEALEAALGLSATGAIASLQPSSRSDTSAPLTTAPAVTPAAAGGSTGGLVASRPGGSASRSWIWAGVLAVVVLMGIGLVSAVGVGVAWRLGALDRGADAPDLAGGYRITDSQNPQGGGAYSGTVLVTRQASAWQVAWSITGGQGYAGVGLVLDRTFAVGFSQGHVHGVCAYRVDRGTLDGACTGSLDEGKVTREKLEGPPGLSGTYQVVGRTGTVVLVPRGDTFDVTWEVDGGARHGIGIRKADQLLVGWAQAGRGYGVVAYEIGQGGMSGVWAMAGGTRLGRETLTRQ